MTTKEEALFVLIESLSELELKSLLEDVRNHLSKNKMLHLLGDDQEEEISELQRDLDDLQKQFDDATSEKDRLVDLVSETKDELESIVSEEAAFDWMQDKIQNVIDKL